MQRNLFKLLGLLFIISSIVTSCKKEKDIVEPKPSPTTKSNLFRFIINQLPGHQGEISSDWNAYVSIVDKNNDTVIKNQSIPFRQNGTFSTNHLELPDGQYRLMRFRITDKKGKTLYAAPMSGSAKAQEINLPLAISFSVPQSKPVDIPVEVVALVSTNTPQDFGYPIGSFDQPEQSENDNNNSFKIKLQASIQIGDITYDHISATVQLKTTENNGNQTFKNIDLEPGINEVLLPSNGTIFHFSMNKWGATAEFFLNASQVREGELYGIVGSRAAKKLKSELSYNLSGNKYIADRKSIFHYNNEGLLSRVDYLRFKTDGTSFTDTYEILYYTDGKVTHIQKFDRYNQKQSESFYTYDVMGNLKTLHDQNSVSYANAVITNFHTPGRFNSNIKYTYSHSDQTLDYNLVFLNGNLEKSTSTNSNGSIEVSGYQYDDAINPFIHQKHPTRLLMGQSKNNVVAQASTFIHSSVQTVPYKFEYTYDLEGYPKEVLTSFKVPATNLHAYILKTVYTYL